MAIHAMVDIETIGTKSDAVVLTVGGVKFDPFSDVEPHSEFLMALDIDEQTPKGRIVDEGTLEWWGKQDSHIVEEAFSTHNRVAIDDFCKSFTKWLVGVDIKWAQGPRFDYGILEHLFEQFGHHKNWFYWQEADSRTLFNLMPRDPRKNLQGEQVDHHSALADAYVQAKAVQKCFKHFQVLQS